MSCNIDNIRKNMENFYTCFNIPIKSISSNSNEIFSFGHDTYTNNLLKENMSTINTFLDDLKEKYFHLYTTSNNVNFIICSICKDSLSCGFFVLGPFKTNESCNFELVLKPKECIYNIVDFLYNLLGKNTKNNLELIKPKKECNLYVNKSIKYIEDNYTSEISLEAVSNYLGINKSYFCDLFKKNTEKTFIQFLNEFRIDKSKDLILKGEINITEISFLVGFSSPNYFNAQFKKITGKTPTEFRNSKIK